MLKRFIYAIIAAAIVTMATTGCNTVRGAGEDVESVGDAMQGN